MHINKKNITVLLLAFVLIFTSVVIPLAEEGNAEENPVTENEVIEDENQESSDEVEDSEEESTPEEPKDVVEEEDENLAENEEDTNENEVEDETLEEAEKDSEEQVIEAASLRAGDEVHVKTFKEFHDAFSANVEIKIILDNDITSINSDPYLYTVLRTAGFTIEGQGHTITLSRNADYFRLYRTGNSMDQRNVLINNTSIIKSYSAYHIFRQENANTSYGWNFTFTDFKVPDENYAPILWADQATVTFDGGHNYLQTQHNGYIFTAGQQLFTNGAVVEAYGNNAGNGNGGNTLFFTGHTGTPSVKETFVVNKGAHLIGSIREAHGGSSMVYFNYATDVLFDGEGTVVDLKSSSYGDNRPVVSIGASASSAAINSGSTFTITNEAKVDIHAYTGTALRFSSPDGVFTSTNGSVTNLTSGGTVYAFEAVMRFWLVGGMTFNIESQSEFNIIRNGGTTYGMRLYGGDNIINVRSGGKFSVINNIPENLAFQNGQDSTGYQAIYYASGTGNGFNVEGYPDGYNGDKSLKSEVTLYANRGPAIYSQNSVFVSQGEDTVFRATGGTASSNIGIFRVDYTLNLAMNNPNYFEFTNLNSKNSIIYAGASNSTFDFTDSDLAIWSGDNANYDGNPSYDWNYLSATLSGSSFNKINTATDASFTANYKTANTHKMTANNAAPIVDELIQPTNADKKIQGHAAIPIGNDLNGRDAWDDEVYVDVEFYSATGELIEAKTLLTKTVTIYDGTTRGGIFTYDIGRFANVGESLKVIRTWKNATNYSDAKARVGKVNTTSTSAVDMTPPNPAVIDQTTVWETTTQLSGTWSEGPEYNADVPVSVYAVLDNQVITSNGSTHFGTLRADHTWVYNFPAETNLNPDSVVHIVLEDANGNKTPLTDTVYHDATFKTSPSKIVQKVLFDISGEGVIIGLEEAAKLVDKDAMLDKLNANGTNLALNTPTDVHILDWNFKAEAGKYFVSVAITESPGFYKTFPVIVLGNDDVVVGDQYVIGANHIKINGYTAKDISNNQLVELSEAKAYLKSDLLSDNPTFKEYAAEVDTHNVGESEATYQATYRVVQEIDTKIPRNVVVDNGNKPELNVSSPYRINVGDTFNALDEVSYSDVETPYEDLIFNYNTDHVDVNKQGLYVVNYSVEDGDHNITTKSRIVMVGKGPVYDEKYVLDGYNFAILEKDVNHGDINTQILELAKASAYEIEGAKSATPIVVDNGGYTNKEGNYTITLGIKDYDDLTKQINVRVIDGDNVWTDGKYYIFSKDFQINTTLAKTISPAQMLDLGNAKGFYIDDKETRDITPVVGTYDIQPTQGSNYYVNFELEEYTQATVKSTVVVSDGLAPTLKVKTPIKLNVGQTITDTIAMDGVEMSDDVTPVNKLILDYDHSHVDVNTPGQYTVEYSLTDEDFNTVTKVRTYIVGNGIVYNEEYTLEGYDFVILANEINSDDIEGQILTLSKARALELVSGNPATPIVSNLNDYKAQEGTYKVELSVSQDTSLTKEITIHVVDGDNITREGNYVITSKDFQINTTVAGKITEDEMKTLGNAKAFYIDDSGSNTEDVIVNDYSITQDTTATHFVEYGVEHVTTRFFLFRDVTGITTVRSNVVVSDGNSPELDFDTPVKLNLNDSVDLWNGVTYFDVETATEDLEVKTTGSVDTSKRGQYTVTYSVTDEDFNTITKVRTYIVGNGIVYNDKYTLEGYDFVMLAKDIDETTIEDEILRRSFAKSINLKDGEEADVIVSDRTQLKTDEGVYEITLQVENDPFLTKKIKIHVVDGDILINEGDYYLTSKHFTINTTVAKDIEDATILNLGNTKGFHIDDNGVTLIDPEVKNHTIEPINKGEYKAFYTLPSVDIEGYSNVSVSDGNAPELSVTTPIQLEVGETLTETIALEGVVYSDVEDSNDDLVLNYDDSNVDVDTPGLYTVEYSVKDTDHNVTKAFRTYLVGEGVFDSEYALVGYDYIILSKDVSTSNPQDQIVELSNAKATKLNDGENAKVIVSDFNGYSKEEKTYTITLTIEGHTSLTKQIKVHVVDGDHVYPSEDNKYFITTKDFKINTTQAAFIDGNTLLELGNVKAFMIDHKGSTPLTPKHVTNTIITVKGNYTATFGIDENEITGDSNVYVTDGSAPRLSVSTPVMLDKGQELTEEIALKDVTYEDDEDTTDKLILTYEDDHVDVDTPGLYTVEYTVEDTDFNKTSKVRTYLVGPGSVDTEYALVAYDYVILAKEVSEENPHDQIIKLSQAFAVELSSGEEAKVVVINADGYANKEGTYNIKLAVEGHTELTIDIKVTVVDGDNIFPSENKEYFITTKDFQINTTEAKDLSNDDILELGNVKAFKVDETGTTPLTPSVVENTVKTDQGEYVVEIKITENNVLGNLKVTVSDGEAPTLEVSTPIVLDKGQELTEAIALQGVDYSDKETAKEDLILNYNDENVDVNTPGQYVVRYTVTDEDHNNVSKVRTYIVGKGVVYNEHYTLEGYDYVILADELNLDDLDSQILTYSKAKAIRLEDGENATPYVKDMDGLKAEEGTYKIILGINEDNLLTKEIKVYVVDGDNIKRDGNYVITSKDFQLNTTQVEELNDNKLKEYGNAKAFYIDDEGSSTQDVLVIEYEITTNQEVSHWVEYGVEHSTTRFFLLRDVSGITTVRSNVTVSNGDAPVLNVPTPVNLEINSEFNDEIASAGITYTDTEDNEAGITLTLDFDASTVDTSIPGIYNVAFSVTDSDYNTTTKVRTYIVGPGVNNEKYALVAYDFVILAKEVDNTNAQKQIIDLAKANAVTLKDGEETPVIVTNFDGYTNKEGTYEIVLAVENDPSVAKTITVNVVDGDNVYPSENKEYFIITKDFQINTTQADEISDESLLELGNVKAFKIDPFKTTVLDPLVKEHDIKAIQGNDYKVTYEIAENSVVGYSAVVVSDGSAPTIDFTTPVSLEINVEYTLEDALKDVVVEDDKDAPEDLTIDVDLDVLDTTTAGIYTVEYTVEDSDFNVTSKVRTFIVGPGVYNEDYALVAYDFIIKQSDVSSLATQQQIKELSKANAVTLADGLTTGVSVVDEGGYEAKEGTYTVELAVTLDPRVKTKINITVVDADIIYPSENEEYFIAAKNFLLNTTQAKDISEESILEFGNAKAFHINPYGTNKLNVTVKSHDINETPSTDYQVVYQIEEDEVLGYSAVEVNNRTAPVIELTTPIELEMNAEFTKEDALVGVDYWDGEDSKEDLELTYDISSVDTSKAGLYKLVYSVEDTDFNVTTKTRTYIVGHGVYNDDYALVAYDYVISENEVNVQDLKAQVLELSKANAYELESGEDATPVVSDLNGYTNEEGVYEVTISVQEDPSLFKTIKINVVEGVVYPDPTNTYFISAKDFQINTTVAGEITHEEILELGNVKAFHISDKETKYLDPSVKEHNILSTPSEDYEVVYKISENEVLGYSNVSVTNGEAPKLEVSTPVKLAKNSVFNDNIAKQGVEYSDKEDTPAGIPLKLTFDASHVDTTTPGIYKVTYTVEDSDFNKTSKVRSYLVGQGSWDEKHLLVGYDYVISKDDVDTNDLEGQILLKSKAHGVELVSGKDVQPEVKDLGGYTNEEGSYVVTLGVHNNSTLEHKITITVVDGTVYPDPTHTFFIVAKDFQINTTTAGEITPTQMLEYGKVRAFKITDEKTQELTPSVKSNTITSTPSEDYEVVYEISEDDVLGYSKVVVSDGNAPVLNVPTPVELEKNSEFNDEVAKAGITYSDIEDDAAGIALTLDFNASNVDTSIADIYTVEFSVTDSDHNTTTKVRTFIVGPGTHDDKYALTGYGFLISKDDVDTNDLEAQILELSKAHAVDLITGEDAEVIVSDLAGYSNTVGDYEVILGIKDHPTLTYTIPVKVIQGKLIPDANEEYYVSIADFEINTTQATDISDEEVMNLSNARVFHKEDNTITELDAIFVDHNIEAIEGTNYYVEVGMAESSHTGRNSVIVSDGNAPVLNVPTPVKLEKNSEFNDDIAKAGVTYSDIEDDAAGVALTLDFNASNVDTTTSGFYKVEFSVTDSDYNTTSKVRVFSVGNSTNDNDYALTGYGFLINKENVDMSDLEAQVIELSKAHAIDLETGKDAEVVVRDLDGYSDTVGDYEVVLGVKDHPALTYTVSVRVTDGPVIPDANEEYYVSIKDFEINTTVAASISEEEVMDLSNARAFHREDNTITELDAVFVDHNIEETAGSDYYVEIGMAESNHTGRNNVVVSDGNAPVLNVPTPVELEFNSAFNDDVAKAGITYSDIEDDAAGIALNLDFNASNVDTSKLGFYKVEFSVTDSDYNTTSKVRTFIVGPNVHNDNYALVAYDFIISKDRIDKDNIDQQIIDAARAQGRFLKDGSETEVMVVEKNGYEAKKGEYDIVFAIKEDPSLTKTIKAIVVDGTIIDPTDNYTMTSSPIRLNTTQAKDISDEELIELGNVRAFKEVEGTITEMEPSVQSHNISEAVGEYEAIFEVLETTRNWIGFGSTECVAETTVPVSVTNRTAPVLNVPTPVKLAKNSEFNDEIAKAGITYSDIEDDAEGIPLTLDFNASNVDTTKSGFYKVEFSVTDSDYNTTSKVRVFSVGNSTNDNDYALTGYGFLINKENVDMSDLEAQVIELSKAHAIDLETGKDAKVVVRDLDGYSNTVGDYEVVLGVKDHPALTYTVSVRVTDGPVIPDANEEYYVSIKDFEINTTVAASISEEEVMDLSNARAFHREDNTITELDAVLNEHNIKGVEGTDYYVEIGMDESSHTGRNNVVVSDGNAPELNVTSPIVLEKDSEFNDEIAKAGITYSDIEDDAAGIALNLDFNASNVDTSRYGLYVVTYSVTDSDFNTTSKVRVYAVGPIVCEEDIILTGRGFLISEEDVDMSDLETQILELSKAHAIDLWTGEDKQVVVRDLGGYSNTVGDYEVVLGVEEEPDLTLTIPVKVTKGKLIPDANEEYYVSIADFEINTTQATDISDEEVMDLSSARVFHREDNTITELDAILIDHNIEGIEGTNYYVEVGMAESSHTGRNSVVVSDGNAPVLNVPTPIKLGKNSEFNDDIAKAGITYSDIEDDAAGVALTLDFNASNVDTTTSGFYKVEFSVTDSDYNTTSKVRVFSVGNSTNDNDYALTGYGFLINKENVDMSDLEAQVIELSKAHAIDLETGKDAEVVVRDLDGYSDTVGDYEVVLGVKDHPALTYTVSVRVTDGPVIPDANEEYYVSIKDFEINTTVAASISEEEVMDLSNARAFHREDNTITELDAVLNEHNIKGVEGTDYYVEIGMAESNHTGRNNVVVSDGNAPELDVTTPIILELNSELTEDILLNGVTYSDTEDAHSDLVLSYDASTVDTSIAGIYTVKYTVTDSDYNTVSKVRTYIVGPNVHNDKYALVAYDFVTLVKDVDLQDLEGQIIEKSRAQAVRLEDGQFVNPVVRDLGGYTNEEGSYIVTIGVENDPSLTQTIKIQVVDGDNIFPSEDNQYFIITKDISINSKLASDIEHSLILTLTNAKGFRITETETTKLDVFVKEHNIVSEEGSYQAHFYIEEDSVKAHSNILVNNGELPQLSVTSPVEIELGGTFDPLAGVTYKDAETSQENLKLAYDVSGVDVNIPGVYKVMYSVTDEDYNTVSALRIYVVNDGNYVFNDEYVLYAKSFSIPLSEVEGTEIEIRNHSEAHAWLVSTGESVDVDFQDLGGYSAKEGTYNIKVSVEIDPSVIKEITGSVYDNTTPKPVEKDTVITLPNTGVAESNAIYLGLILVLSGITLYLEKKRRENK